MARPVQGQAPPWGTDLNSWLDVAHAADGTQKYPGSSYLVATQEEIGPVSSAFEFVDWTLVSSLGSDITIDGGDASKLNFATTGLYFLQAHVDIFAWTTGKLSVASAAWLVNGGLEEFTRGNFSDTPFFTTLVSTLPQLLPLTAGDYVQLQVTATTDGDTWGSTGANVPTRIYRFA